MSLPIYFAYIDTPEEECTLLLQGRNGNSGFTKSGKGISLPPAGLKVSAPHSAFAPGCGGRATVVVSG